MLALAACQTTTEWEYARSTPPGCYSAISQHGEAVDKNVVLEASFEKSLVELVPVGQDSVNRCWFLTPDKRIKLVAGDACGPHGEHEFQTIDNAWALVQSRREDIVLCHERR